MRARQVVLWLVAAGALAGCGRVWFADLDDAASASGHDEDGDGIPDVEDPCPHVPGDRADLDGDGVGDACDRNPGEPREQWVLFRTMQPGDQPFTDASMFTQEADALRATQDTGTSIAGPFATERIDIGFEIFGTLGAGQHQIAAGVQSSSQSLYYFVELNENDPTRDAGIFSYDNVNGYASLDAATIPGIHPGIGFLRFDAIGGATQAWALQTGWIGELYQAQAATPGYAGGDYVNLVTNGLDVAIRYVAIIQTK